MSDRQGLLIMCLMIILFMLLVTLFGCSYIKELEPVEFEFSVKFDTMSMFVSDSISQDTIKVIVWKLKKELVYTICYRDSQLTRNFKLSEFWCSGDSNKVIFPNVYFISGKAQEIRDIGLFALRVTSGCRTPAYNLILIGQGYNPATNSLHLNCIAMDISTSIAGKDSDILQSQLYWAWVQTGGGGFGWYIRSGGGWVHVDFRCDPPFNMEKAIWYG